MIDTLTWSSTQYEVVDHRIRILRMVCKKKAGTIRGKADDKKIFFLEREFILFIFVCI